MKIDRRLHLVVPIYDDELIVQKDADDKPVVKDGKPVMIAPIVAYVHSTPLAADVIDRYFMVLGQTFQQLFTRGLGITAGPSVAMRLLKKTATDNGVGDDVHRGLIEEIRRLTMVIVADGRAWQPMPLQIAVDSGKISADDQAEVENAIAFFIVVSAVTNRAQRREMIESAADLWGAQTSFLNSTEFAISLGTSTEIAPSGEKSPAPAKRPAGHANATVGGKPASVPV